MEYQIIKRINAETLQEAIKNEASGEVVSVELKHEENFKTAAEKKIGFKKPR